MEWFYVRDNEQKGPLDQAEFARLIQTGEITPATLIWREGMKDWVPQGQLPPSAPSLVDIGGLGGVVCSECGGTFSLDQTIRLGSGHVCANCKGVAMQKLREGVANNDSAQIRQAHIKHEASVKSIGILYFLAAISFLLMGVATILAGWVAVLFLIFSGALIWVGIGLRKLKPWARIPTGIFAGLGLLGFPLGTIINAYILYLIFSQKGKTVFSEDYKRVIQETPHIKYKTSILVWILIGLVIFIVLFAMIAAFIAKRR